MDNIRYEHYLSRLKFAEPANISRYSTKDGTIEDRLEPVQAQEPQAAESTDQPGPSIQTVETCHSSLFVIPGIGSNDSPIQMERAVFRRLLADMQIPKRFFKSMTEYGGHYSTFVSHEERDGQFQPKSIWFMVSTPPTTWGAFSCCLRVHVDDKEVSGILLHDIGDQPRDIPHLLQRRPQTLSMSPVSFLVSMLEAYEVDERLTEAQLALAIQNVEGSTGFWEQMSSTIPAAEYEKLNKILHHQRIRLSMLRRKANFQQELGQFLHNSVELVDHVRAERGKDPEPICRRSAVLQDVEYHMTTCRRLQTELGLLHERIQVQIDVMRGFIVQRDAQASISLAATTQQDSGAMRIIAVISLVLLPATLVSAIFSSGVIVSAPKLWWVFLLAIVLLTLVVFTLWFWLMRYRAKSTDRIVLMES